MNPLIAFMDDPNINYWCFIQMNFRIEYSLSQNALHMPSIPLSKFQMVFEYLL